MLFLHNNFTLDLVLMFYGCNVDMASFSGVWSYLVVFVFGHAVYVKSDEA